MAYEVTIGTDNNISVSLSQVGQQGSKGADWEGAWVTSTAYAVNDVVKNNGTVYICILAHTADAASEPGVGGSTATYWEVFAEGGADGTDGDGWTGGSYNASTGIVTFTSTDGLGFATGDLRGADGTDGDGWTGGSYDAGTGVVTFTSTDGLGFATSDLRGTDGTDGDGWTGGSYNTSTGIVTFTSTDGLGFATGDLRGADGTGFTGGSYNASTGVVTFTSDDGLGFTTDDLRGIDWQGSWVTATSYDVNDTVENNGSSYICILAHTSASTNEPGVGVDTATYWELIAQKGTDGDGAGTVTSVDVAGGTGLTSSGGPVTTSGTITVALDSATQSSLSLADTSVQPTDIGTAAPLNVPATGDAAAGEVVKGDDTRLSDARTPTAHTHTKSDITDFNESDYATGAEGDLAATALQPNDNISTLTNDAGYTTNVGDITGVTAGTGLSGGGLSGAVTVNVDEASQAQVRALTNSALPLTTRRVRDASAITTPSGSSNWTPDWEAFVSADWNVTANRTINNPTNVIPGTTRVVKIRASTSTARTISWGSYYKGNIPIATVTNAAFLFVTLTAISATEIIVSHLEYS